MLVFIIPVKSPAVSTSWDRFSKLFERCIKSVCNQTLPNFRVIVVCNDRPAIEFRNSHIDYIEVDFPPPDSNQRNYGQVRGAGDADKARKVLTGIAFADKFQPSHLMVVDADDCVSKYLAEFVARNSQADGWFLKKGYVYEEGSKFIYLNLKNFNQSCGTSIVIKYGLHNLLFPNKNYYDHNHHILQNGVTLKALPFVGAVYSIRNAENMFMSTAKTQQLKDRENSLLFAVKKAVKYRPMLLTKTIRDDFSLYKIN
ncbi:glycosyltransferase family 2 protein [Chroococcidiopsis sp. CCALA 051]|uniref:glycosyltransferase family 2 protein n=1 Tax=Chroococcidiopsis sp. CCALA 051 TaxID=869949 RepID=UPI000D0E15C8|nr:glycosyltransferase family 2 protein [Chroococcidiopsis sp. CCALA 051]MBE9015934.1 glycosyltransferase family 2 protein [Chroococcidiopsidales cyanobacterium LEGE 13417]PSM48514.1 glycosyltransferase family 2 protein [Chroococcidiopsis sp. CCALA 051]